MDTHRSRPWVALGTLALVSTLAACDSDPPHEPEATSTAPRNDAPKAASPDRLAPGELLEGTETAYGLVLPRKLVVERRFPKATHAVGKVDLVKLGSYVKQRVRTAHVYMEGEAMVFPQATIRGTDHGLYRIEIAPSEKGTRLTLRDITPQPRTEGLSEAQRWEKAGMKPSGGFIDPNAME